jgi:hypothetical protein
MLSSYPLKIYAICCVILYLKMFGVGFLQGFYRTKNKAFTNPEDAKAFAQTEAVAQDPPEVERANKIYRNDLENIPIFLFLALCYVM